MDFLMIDSDFLREKKIWLENQIRNLASMTSEVTEVDLQNQKLWYSSRRPWTMEVGLQKKLGL